jgi:uncharacterized protein YeaO (DUF488 family)
MQRMTLKLKRIYEPFDPTDGMRVLVDRLWPRGVRKTDANLDVWLKDIAPSRDLCAWFGHDQERFTTFRSLYERELAEDEAHIEAVKQVVEWCRLQSVTLLYAARDPVCNHARVLHDYILAHMESE